MLYHAADMVMRNSRCNCCALLSANKFSVTLTRFRIETEIMSIPNTHSQIFINTLRRHILLLGIFTIIYVYKNIGTELFLDRYIGL